MKAGLLNEIISIHRQVEVTSDYGDISTTYQRVCTTRANVEHKLGERAIENNEIFYAYPKTFKVRHYVDIKDKDRIEYDGNTYRVVSIERNKPLMQIAILTELVNE